jgi:hypothetical protein
MAGETYDRAADPGDTGVECECGGGTGDLAGGDEAEMAGGPEG